MRKSVVIASGKGGTGKTTVTAAFAHLAAEHHRLVVADTDVEASNLPLALHPQDVSCEAFSGGTKADIDAQICTQCGVCEDTCRFGAVSPSPQGVFRVNPFLCEGCTRCALLCPAGAVTMVPSAVGEACSGESATGPVAFGQLGPGEDLSGKLVTEVRRLAATAAERTDADLVLIDGPPGVGCPLIAAVSGADLVIAVAEPSVSGAHDLERLVQLAERLHVPVSVVLNKTGLSEDGAMRIRAMCELRGLKLVAELPFDEAMAVFLETLAQGDIGRVLDQSSFGQKIADAWRTIEKDLRLGTGTGEPAGS
jgi:MinD superfamily P-loop ATPase